MSYTQTGRLLSVTTPLGKDYFILNGFTGHESISRLFRFELQCIATNDKKPSFDALLGQSVTAEVTLPDKSKKYLNGICNRVAQGARDQTFTLYLLDIVPKFWLLTRKTQSRIFQHITVPDIVKKVLADGKVDFSWEVKGTFQPRDFCVQYRESDYAFASRLMEEEGIYYFFKHQSGSHTMVVANDPGSH
ncbi:MAG: type VI secretion system Vgr family protein, partial [Acidithiobacillales bacterium]